MRKLLAHSVPRHRFILFTAVVVSMLTLLLVQARHVFAASESVAGKRIITIHDRGEEIGLLTEDSTLRQVLADAHIDIDKNDLVEPGLDEKLVADSYQVNIYRARPVVIVDGASVKKVLSPYQTPSQIAQHAGITLRDEDKTDIEPISDVVSYGAGVEVSVDRATPLKLELYGATTTVYTQAHTVGEFVREKGITLGKHDKLSLDEATPIRAGMKVAIWRDGKQTITRKESIAFPVERIEDADRPVGYHHVKTAGQKGQKMVTYEAFMKNGRIVKKKKIQSVVLKKATKQVEVIGTKVSLPPGSHEDWMRKAGMNSGDFGYINYIFMHESGWNPAAVSPGGAYVGLGQTNPANLSGACPSWQSDPICQIKFFDGYKSRYGSWEAAYEFKRDNGWW